MVPPTPTGPLPLVVLLHGAFVTGSAEAARTGFGTLSASGAAVVVAPESHGPARTPCSSSGPAQSAARYRSQPGFPESASGMTLFWPLLHRADRV